MYMYIYHTHTHMYVYVYVYIYIHTLIHTFRGHMEGQAKLSVSEQERRKLMEDLAKADEDRTSLKAAVRAATDAIRRVADQRCVCVYVCKVCI